MEETEGQKDDCSVVFPRWYDSHNRPYQSQWLQTTLSDMDMKTQKILDLLHGDGDSFTERAEMFYERRPELIESVQDLRKSYCSLAENFDHLIMRSDHSKPPCPPLKSDQNGHHLRQDSLRGRDKYASGPNLDCLEKKANELKQGEESNNPKMGFNNPNAQEERERAREELMLKVSKLIGDNLKEQAELVRKYSEKKEIVRNLQSQITRLMDENRVLKSYPSLPSTNNNVGDVKGSDQSQCHGSKLSCIGRFGGCS